jgi:hypothetical protein
VSTSGYPDDVLVVEDLVDESMLDVDATREEKRGQSPVKKQADTIFSDENFSQSTGCGVLVGVWHTRSDRFRLP